VRPPDAKLQRWIDLLAALLGHRYGVTFAELKALVPGYGEGEGNGKDAATLARMFERDKDELRALGLPIRVRGDGATDGGDKRYVVKPREMYLPYVALVSRSTGSASVRHVPPPGYREVPTLLFEPDELSALVRAVRKAKAAGDPALARDAESAMQKLSYDLGASLGVVAEESQEVAVRAPEVSAAPAVMVLGEGLLKRKQVTFAYRSMSRDVTETRTVEPKPGLLLLWESWLRHEVLPGTGGAERLSISFNFA
jgi:proteasome accessory factor B